MSYIFRNLEASVRIILGNRQGVLGLDGSASGFWRSFMALVLALPFTLSNRYAEYNTAVQNARENGLAVQIPGIFVQEIAAIIAYLLSLLVLYFLTKTTGAETRFPISVVAINWGSLGMTILTFPLLAVMGQLSSENLLIPILVLMLIVIFTLAMFNILRLTLESSLSSTFLNVIILSMFEIFVYFGLLTLIE